MPTQTYCGHKPIPDGGVVGLILAVVIAPIIFAGFATIMAAIGIATLLDGASTKWKEFLRKVEFFEP